MLLRILKFIGKLLFILILLSIVWVVILRFVPVYYTPLMAIRSVEAQKKGEMLITIQKKWVSIDEISPYMAQAVIAAEDNLFMEHNGFSWNDIRKAAEENKKGKRIRGGSTISQQTAKNVFLWPGRSYIRKGLEAYFTTLIELLWSKEHIMEVYLNVIETGPGIYGVEAASQIYFNTNADKLTKSQAALIAVCLPNPRLFNPQQPSSYIKSRQKQILHLMDKIGPINLKQKNKHE